MIFCVEDDESIREMEVYTLRQTGFEAEGFADGTAFFAALADRLPELVLLDVMLPGQDGIAILKTLRANPRTREIPVVMATARGAEYDKVTALDGGADDYLAKPFGMMEMASRVRAVLRRTAPKAGQSALRMGPIEMDLERHAVTVEGNRVELTYKEFEMLRLFLAHPGMAFTRDMLLGEVWGIDYGGETRTVDVHIRMLRQKLGAGGMLIETVRGVGYRMEARST